MYGERLAGSATPLVLCAALPAIANAHAPAVHGGTAIAWQWDFDPVVAVLLALASWAYLGGVRRLWRRAGVGRGICRHQAALHVGGLLVLAIALLSPLDALSSASFGAHMVQHLLLILVAPPLLVAGAADLAYLWALPKAQRPGFGAFERRVSGWLGGEPDGGCNRLVVVALATGMLWLWHVPALYDAAVRHQALHTTEHVGFLVTALLFWAGVLRLRPTDHAHNGARILAVAAMALQGGLLGALLTFASRPLYDSHRAPSFLGFDPLVDQQLAGLLMWVPPAFLYVGVLAYLFVHWLDTVGRRNRPASRHRP